MVNNRPKRTLYGRRQGRPLNKTRREMIDVLLPRLRIPVDKITENANLTTEDIFNLVPTESWLEIGFGNGEHLAALMRQNPENAYIGAEPFINGMAAFLKYIKDEPHDRIRVWMDDAMPVVESLADETLDGIYVLNPDPWPKTRHHKRRIIRKENLDQFARVLKPDGKLIMATDVDELAEWMVTQASIHPAFTWTAQTPDDWKTTPADWIKTRYEEKGAKSGRKQSYLIFERNGTL